MVSGIREFMADYMTRVANGEISLPCDAVTDLTADLMAAALAVDGGPKADGDASSFVTCCFHPGHKGLHYAVVRNLTAGAVWLRWRGLVCELVTLEDCGRELNGGMDLCSLFAGHDCSHR